MAKTTRGIRLLKRDRVVYDVLHAGWRAGYVWDFYCGKRSPSDPTIVWRLDGVEYAHEDRAQVLADAEALREAAGVAAVAVGDTWCGYAAVTVEYYDGRTWTEHYNGVRLVNTYTAAALEVAA